MISSYWNASRNSYQHCPRDDSPGRPTAARDKALKLLRGQPELRSRVLAGTLAPSAALIQAGRRRRYLRVDRDDVRAAVAAILKIFGRAAVEAALANVNESGARRRPRSATSPIVGVRSSPAADGVVGPQPGKEGTPWP